VTSWHLLLEQSSDTRLRHLRGLLREVSIGLPVRMPEGDRLQVLHLQLDEQQLLHQVRLGLGRLHRRGDHRPEILRQSSE